MARHPRPSSLEEVLSHQVDVLRAVEELLDRATPIEAGEPLVLSDTCASGVAYLLADIADALDRVIEGLPLDVTEHPVGAGLVDARRAHVKRQPA
jgi:hypothetical protein